MVIAEIVKKNKFVSASALVGMIISIIAAVWLFEDRYFTVAKAQNMEIRIVQTFRQFQMRQDVIMLDDLYRRKILYERLLKNFPYDEGLKREYESICKEIERLSIHIRKSRNGP